MDKKFNKIYFSLLLIILLFVSFPSLFFPPISDYWEMLYSFHHLERFPGTIKCLNIFNFDPVEQVGYRPLAHFLYYIIHLIVGSNYTFFNVINFLFYFLSIMLIYKFSLHFVNNKILTASLITSCAFLFSHFDIVLWSCHLHIIIGFSAFLIGFMLYIKFLNENKLFLFFILICLFLTGMFCYEAFFLWPLAIIFISSIKKFRKTRKLKRFFRINIGILASVYIFYIIFFYLIRSLGTYSNSLHDIYDFLNLKNFISSAFLVVFNILYNNILVNIFPPLTFPLKVTENIYMSGTIINYVKANNAIVFMISSFAIVSIVSFSVYMYRKKFIEEIKIIALFIFLIFSELYIVYLGKLGTNSFEYGLTEFRYQYIPNVFVILITILLFDRFVKLTKIKKRLFFVILTLVFIINIYHIQKIIDIYNRHLVNLERLLTDIKVSIREGLISENEKVYIDDNLPDYFPSLCWNVWMGEQFVEKGNYQWVFSKNELRYFSPTLKDAVWMVDKEDFIVVKKSPENIFKQAEKIHSGKEEQYINLGNFYKNQGEYKEAEKMFKKLVELDTKSDIAYLNLGHFYKEQRKYNLSENMFKKALELNPANYIIYVGLGHLYNEQERYEESEKMFILAVEENPDCPSAYHGLGCCYRDQSMHEKAEEMFLKAMDLNLDNYWIYVDLGHLYNEQRKYRQAEEMFKKAIEINPENPHVYYALEECYRNQGKNEEAKKLLQKIKSLNL